MIVDSARYAGGHRDTDITSLDEVLASYRRSEPGSFVWIGLHEPTAEEFDRVSTELDLHELSVEDAIDAHQRPKLEVYGDSLFVVIKTTRYNDSAETVEFAETMVFVGDSFVVTVRHGDHGSFTPVRAELERRPDQLEFGPAAVLHAVVDKVVDDYAPVLDGLDIDVQQVEYDVFSPEPTNPAERIYKLKRQVLDFHRNTAPLLEALGNLTRGRYSVVHPELAQYFRDVDDHLRRVTAQVDSMSDLLTNVLEANLAQISVRQNEDTRRMSAWAAMFLLPTVLAGVWGMNFNHMPELNQSWGYPFALGTMIASSLTLYAVFKRTGWL